MADEEHGVRIARDDSSPATACLRDRDSWSARRAAAGRARRTARRRAPRACASRRRRTRPGRACAAASKPRPARMRAARASAECASMSASRDVDVGDAVADRSRSRPRPAARRARVSAVSTISISGSSVPRRLLRHLADARALRHRRSSPVSAARSPVMARNSVVLPAPLRPTRPALVPAGSVSAGVVEEQAPGDAQRKVVDLQHGQAL